MLGYYGGRGMLWCWLVILFFSDPRLMGAIDGIAPSYGGQYAGHDTWISHLWHCVNLYLDVHIIWPNILYICFALIFMLEYFEFINLLIVLHPCQYYICFLFHMNLVPLLPSNGRVWITTYWAFSSFPLLYFFFSDYLLRLVVTRGCYMIACCRWTMIGILST